MLDLRSLVRDLTGFILYIVSWYCLAIVPLLIIAKALSESGIFGIRFLDGISFVEAVAFGINLMEAALVGLVLRWLARGVIENNGIKTIFVALCIIGASSFCAVVGYLASEIGPSWARQLPIVSELNTSLATPLQVIIFGAFFFVVGLILCIVAISAVNRDRT
jgi:hypothetical protein